MPNKERKPDPGLEVATQWSALAALASRQPLLALAAVFVMAGGGGTVGSMYVAPLVDDALDEHEADERAHRIDRLEDRLRGDPADPARTVSPLDQVPKTRHPRLLEDRLDRLERKIDQQGRGLVELKAGVETAVKILEG